MSRVTVTARDANQNFARVLSKAADDDATVIITRRGKPVAQLSRYRPDTQSPERQAAGKRLLAQLREPIPVPEGWLWNRDELYERN